MAIRGYVPVELAAQCEGTCTRDCNYLISEVVTKPGPTAQGEILSLPRTDSIKAQRGSSMSQIQGRTSASCPVRNLRRHA